jgi:hypothetical protein
MNFLKVISRFLTHSTTSKSLHSQSCGKYGDLTKYDPACWTYLVKVTHWTDEDVVREKDLKARFSDVRPDYTIDSISELPKIVNGSEAANRIG